MCGLLAVIKKQYRGQYILLSIFTLFAAFTSPFTLADVLFFNKDADVFLAEEGIILKDEHTVLSYRNVGGIDTYTEFVLKISMADKQHLAAMLLSSPHFRDSSVRYELLLGPDKLGKKVFRMIRTPPVYGGIPIKRQKVTRQIESQ